MASCVTDRRVLRTISPKVIILLAALAMGVSFCGKSPVDDDGNGITPGPVYPDIDQYPSWSPDGNVIVYYHTGITSVSEYGGSHVEPDSVGLWFISPAGDNKRQFLKGENFLPAWSPDGKGIAFVNGAQIYKIKADGDSLTQLTFEGSNFFPAFSPDGRWIAHSRSVCESDSTCGIWIVSDDGEQRRFIDAYGMYPTWFPSSKKVLYSRRAVAENGEVLGDSLWAFDIQQNTRRFIKFLTGENLANRYFAISPDGSKIAFTSTGGTGGTFGLFSMDPDGGNLQHLTKDGNYPSWSPDGNFIVFTRHSREFSDDNGHLWIMDSNGENKRQLTFMNE